MTAADQSYCEVQLDAEENYCGEFYKEQDYSERKWLLCLWSEITGFVYVSSPGIEQQNFGFMIHIKRHS